MAPSLSILIPTYNREKFICKTLDSVLSQEFSDYEIICSDNSSTDNTYRIIQRYQQTDDRIKLFKNSKNLGPVLNWKKCLDRSTGSYIHWLWSDDWIEPNFYIDAFSLLKQGNTDIITTWNYRNDNVNDDNDRYISWQCSINEMPSNIAAKKILLRTGELPLSPAAYILPSEHVKKSFFTNIPKVNDILDPVSKGVGVDSLMITGSCLAVNKISVLQKPSVTFRKHNNLSAIYSENDLLRKMYYISHIWFIQRFKIKLNYKQYVKQLYIFVLLFEINIKNKRLLYLIFSYLIKALMNLGNYPNEYKYVSKKGVFK